MNSRLIWQISVLVGIFSPLCFQCDSPVSVPAPLEIQEPVSASKLLAGDTITITCTRSIESVVLSYQDVSGGVYGTDTAWKSFTVVSLAGHDARVVLPSVKIDSMIISAHDTVSGAVATTAYRLNHFILTRYPDVDRIYNKGDTVQIAWRASSQIGEAILMLRQDNGRRKGFITGGEAVRMPVTSYRWVIGSDEEVNTTYPAQNCSVFIVDYNESEWTDEMPGTFSVLP